MQSHVDKQIDYVKRTVAFIDILGFGGLVQEADSNERLRGKLFEALSKVSAIAAPNKGDSNLRAQNFSDSLIISADYTTIGFWHTVITIDALIWNLMQIGIFIRGGVTVGRIHHDDKVVFGPAVNKAYTLESKIANYARIVIDAAVMEALNSFGKDDPVWKPYLDQYIRRDDDGVYFLNFLDQYKKLVDGQETNVIGDSAILLQAGQKAQKLLQNELDTLVEHPDAYPKIKWLANQWNNELFNNDISKSSTLTPIQLAKGI